MRLASKSFSYSDIKKILTFICTVFFTVVMLSGCSLYQREQQTLTPPMERPPTEIIQTTDVKRGTLENSIVLKGTFVALKEEELSFKDAEGYLKSIYVKAGVEVKAGQLLAELDTDHIKNEVQLANIDLKASLLDYEKLKMSPNCTSYELSKLSLVIENKKNTLENLQSKIAHTLIYAPFDGEITSILKVAVGDYISPNTLLMKLSDPSQLQLQCKPGQMNNLFQIGTKVIVYFNGYNPDSDGGAQKEKYGREGIVTMCPSTIPSDADSSLQGTVVVKVLNLPSQTNINETVDVHLAIEKRVNAIYIPKRLVEIMGNSNFVYVVRYGIKVRQDVELGIEVRGNVEIVKGLNEKDKVVTYAMDF